MPEPCAAEEWARKITGVKDDGYEWNIIIAKNLRAYAEQETTSQKLQIAVLIRLLERVRDAEDPEEYLDDVAAVDESTLAEESRVFLWEHNADVQRLLEEIAKRAAGEP